MTEYGGDTLEGLHSVTPVPWTEEYQVDLLAMYHRVFDRVEAVVGEQVWTSPTSPPDLGSCESAATRRVSSFVTVTRRPLPMHFADDGASSWRYPRKRLAARRPP